MENKTIEVDFTLGETVYAVVNNKLLAGVVTEITAFLHLESLPRPDQEHLISDFEKIYTRKIIKYTVDFGEEKVKYYSEAIYNFSDPCKTRLVSELSRDRDECKKAYLSYLEKNL
jgi:hypothetical protein